MDLNVPDLISITKKLCHFLENYLPLANAHVADFIIEDYWNRFVPDVLRQELLELDETALAKLPSGDLYQNTDYVNQIATMSLDHESHPKDAVHAKPRALWDTERTPNWKAQTLEDFIMEARHNTLPLLNVLTDVNQLKETWKSGKGSNVVIQEFMTAKKSHEVDIMAEVCSCLATYINAKVVVDIGSGRGYLSSHLNLMYGHPVLAIDSSLVNTNSAQKREKRLEKHWAGIVRNAKAKVPIDNMTPQEPPKETDVGGFSSDPLTETRGDQTDSSVVSQIKENPGMVPITQFVTPKTDLQLLVDEHLGSKAAEDGIYVNEAATCDQTEQEESAARDTLILTGLHTCGNLAPSIMDIFINGRGKIAGLCNVGCCYHHIDEEFLLSPFQNTDTTEPDHFGFPLSGYMRGRGFQLGRNARMLASQTPARMSDSGKLSHTSLFYRALLQVILRDLVGEIKKEWQVGKIFSKSKDFNDYARRALKKLNIDKEVKEEVINGYLEQYAHCERELSAFVQLRAALAPVIEALILTDRLIYLKEQEKVNEAHLVQLFDDVKSPRCYGLIATRR